MRFDGALALSALLVLCTGCGAEDLFFVSRAGADMPVGVRGADPTQSLILYLHGGPAGSAFRDRLQPVFAQLEESHAVAYWDQRASGLAQGDPSPPTFTLPSFVEDLDLVV